MIRNIFVTCNFDLSLPIDYNPIKIQKEIELIMKKNFKCGAIISEVKTEMQLDKEGFPIFTSDN